MAFLLYGPRYSTYHSLMKLKKFEFKKWAYRILLPFLGVLLTAWLAMILFLPSFIKSQVQSYGQSIGYQINYQSLAVSPWALKLEVEGFELSSQQGAPLLQAKHLVINSEAIHWAIGRIHFSEIAIEELQLNLHRSSSVKGSAQWNWVEFFQAMANHQKNKDASSSALKVSVSELHLKKAYLKVDDRLTQTKYELPHINLSAHDLANYDMSGRAGAQGDYSIHLGALDIPVTGSVNHLKLNHLSFQGHMEMSAKEVLKARLDLKINDALLKSQFQMSLKSSELNGSIDFQKLPLAPFIALLPSNKPLLTEKGTVSAQLKIKTAKKGWSILGDIDFGELAVFEPGQKEALLTWGSARFQQFELNFLDAAKRRFMIGELAIREPAMRLTIGEDGLSNFRRMFAKSPGSKDTNDAVSKSKMAQQQNESTSPSRVQVDFRAVKVSNGSMYFKDLSLKSKFATRIRALNGSLLGVSNVPGQYALLALEGQVDRRGSMRARGQMAFDDPRRNNDIQISFKNIPLNSINSYSKSLAGYEIESGRIDLDLQYTTKNGRLVGKNHFVINQIKLGPEIEDLQGKKLPIRLAISLLEDSDGMIDVNIPVKGNVDAPEFSMGHLVWQAISNIVSNIVSAPFKAMGALLGGDDIDGVYFNLGESVITPPQRERLEKLAAVLQKRPAAQLELYGTYDAQSDRSELSRVRADRAILMAAGFKLSEDEPLPSPSLADPRIQSGLKSAYGSQVGHIQLARRLLLLPNTPERWTLLRDELIKSYVITDVQLSALALQRAQNARTVLLKKSPELASRVTVGRAQSTQSEEEGVLLGVSLKR